MPINLNEVLSINEACDALKISKPTLYKSLKERGVELIKYNGCSFVSKELVEDWLRHDIWNMEFDLGSKMADYDKYFGEWKE